LRNDVALSEDWQAPTRETLQGVVRLAAAHLQGFIMEFEEVRARLLALEGASK
jgi:hypothetical protein